MADNITLPAMTGGANVASDEIAGIHHQRVKVQYGLDGSATDVSASNPLPVVQTGALPAGDNNIGNVDIVTMPNVTISTMPNVTVATLPSLPAGTNNIGDVDVLSLPALPAGNNNIGDVDIASMPSLPAGNNNIGDVDVLSVIPGTGATNLGKSEDAAHTTGDVGVMALAVRNDAGTSLVNATGDYAPLQVDSTGALRVTSNSTQQYAEDAAHTTGDLGTMALAVRLDAPATIAGASGDYTPLQVDATGSLRVVVTGGASTAAADNSAFTANTTPGIQVHALVDETGTTSVTENQVGAFRMTADRKLITTPYAHATAGGITPAKYISAATTNATSVKASAGKIHSIIAINTVGNIRYLKLYNRASAPTVGTDVPIHTIPIPANVSGAGVAISFGDIGLAFSTGIAFAITANVADNDATAIGANDVVINLGYV